LRVADRVPILTAAQISPADLHAPIAERPASAASAAPPAVNGAHRPPGLEAASLQRTASTDTATTAASPAMPGGFGGGDNEDWGGDLMNVEADEGDYGKSGGNSERKSVSGTKTY